MLCVSLPLARKLVSVFIGENPVTMSLIVVPPADILLVPLVFHLTKTLTDATHKLSLELWATLISYLAVPLDHAILELAFIEITLWTYGEAHAIQFAIDKPALSDSPIGRNFNASTLSLGIADHVFYALTEVETVINPQRLSYVAIFEVNTVRLGRFVIKRLDAG